MMKKLLLSLVFIFAITTLYSQTIVTTTPENRKVILEEFTGIHCVYCPDGHAIAQSIQDNNPGEVFLVNIHVGGYATPNPGEPDFRTPFGTAIANQSNLAGYPAGTINRHVFPGLGQNPNSSAMSRNQWSNAANQIMGQSSYVNVGVEASINVQTNELVVHVEAYYTGNSPEATNKLNVALLQNETFGPQTGGGAGNMYLHQHRLVHLLTGQWGTTISTTTTGTFVDETFTYTIPADYNGVPVELADLELVAFISETNQEIASGNGAYPTYTGINVANDAAIDSIEAIDDACFATEYTTAPKVTIENLGQNTITSLAIEYSVNGGTPEVYNWSGSITSYQDETIELPSITFPIQANNTVSISIPDDENNANNALDVSFDAIDATSTVDMVLNVDQWGQEVRWNIKDKDGATIYNGGPYPNSQPQTINETFDLPGNCYTFNLIDTYGDGGGSVTLTDSNAQQIFYTNGSYGNGDSQKFSTEGFILGIGSNEIQAISIYPNPATTVLNIKNAENSTIEVYNMLGQVLYTKSNISIDEQVEVSQLNAGTYFVKITNGDAVRTTKFLKK